MLPGSEKKFYGSRKICTGKKACLRLKNSPLRRTGEIFSRSDFTLRGNRVRATTLLNQNIGFVDRKKRFTRVEKYLRVKNACLRSNPIPRRRTGEIFFRSDFTLRGNRVRATTWLNQNIGFLDRKKSFTGVEKYLRVKKPV